MATLAMECFALVYMVALMLGFPWLSEHVFGPKYLHISGLILVWGVYFAINSARNVGTTALVSFGAFRAMFWQGLSSALILVLACLVLIPRFGVYGALGAMIFVEICELLVNWFYLLPMAKQNRLKLE